MFWNSKQAHRRAIVIRDEEQGFKALGSIVQIGKEDQRVVILQVQRTRGDSSFQRIYFQPRMRSLIDEKRHHNEKSSCIAFEKPSRANRADRIRLAQPY